MPPPIVLDIWCHQKRSESDDLRIAWHVQDDASGRDRGQEREDARSVCVCWSGDPDELGIASLAVPRLPCTVLIHGHGRPRREVLELVLGEDGPELACAGIRWRPEDAWPGWIALPADRSLALRIARA